MLDGRRFILAIYQFTDIEVAGVIVYLEANPVIAVFLGGFGNSLPTDSTTVSFLKSVKVKVIIDVFCFVIQKDLTIRVGRCILLKLIW